MVLLIVLLMPLHSIAHASDKESKIDLTPPVCTDELHALRTKELSEIFQADQSDRDPLEVRSGKIGDFQEIMKHVVMNDFQRRKRVGELFGEGCIITADDYYHAAMVFQHGIVPDHFFQAYVWASRAAEKGNKEAIWLAAASLDRYLMNLGYKQIYATQAKTLDNNPTSCWCLWPVEKSASEEIRKAKNIKSISEQLDWLKTLNHDKKGCAPSFCSVDAKPAPRNSIAGVSW